jgi:predicted nucleic acid-binding protein
LGSAYIDTSCLLAVLFEEVSAARISALLESDQRFVSSNLLEAELRSALAREKVTAEPSFLSDIHWIHAERALSAEIRRTLAAGYLRGSDLWHVASALYLAENPAELPFLTLDRPQARIAGALGFPTPLQTLS